MPAREAAAAKSSGSGSGWRPAPPAAPRGPRPRPGTMRRECARRGTAPGRRQGRRAPSGNRRTGSARLDCDAAPPGGVSTAPKPHETDAYSFSSSLARRSSLSRASAGPSPPARGEAGGRHHRHRRGNDHVGPRRGRVHDRRPDPGIDREGGPGGQLAADAPRDRRCQVGRCREERHQDPGRLRLGELRGRGPDRRLQRPKLGARHDPRPVEGGAILDAASNAGANEVYGPTLSRSDEDALQAKALRDAVRMRARRPRRSRMQPVSGSVASQRSPRASPAGRSRTTRAPCASPRRMRRSSPARRTRRPPSRSHSPSGNRTKALHGATFKAPCSVLQLVFPPQHSSSPSLARLRSEPPRRRR